MITGDEKWVVYNNAQRNVSVNNEISRCRGNIRKRTALIDQTASNNIGRDI